MSDYGKGKHDSKLGLFGGRVQKYTDPLSWILGDKYTKFVSQDMPLEVNHVDDSPGALPNFCETDRAGGGKPRRVSITRKSSQRISSWPSPWRRTLKPCTKTLRAT